MDLKKYLKKLPKKDVEKILDTIESLAKDPRPRWVEKLKSRPGYRTRAGNYRIIYTIDDGKLIVCVIDVDDRKDVYK
ncbi:MAG: type II toxin-antitoxin system RelE/ParE family toxin [Verrucomicrobia bacterium]|nr:type II toxin-antitoxin system RelE/ParE family toxin [Verrucomicrobiota bacterium]